jgi:hypothetical protein
VDCEKEFDGEVLASLSLRFGYILALVFLAEHWSLDRWITHIGMERSSEHQGETFIPLMNELIYLFRDFLPQLPIASRDRGKSMSGIVVRSKLEAQHHSTHSESLPVCLWDSSIISDRTLGLKRRHTSSYPSTGRMSSGRFHLMGNLFIPGGSDEKAFYLT